MEEYNRRMQDENGPGLKDIWFYGKDYEDDHKHVDIVLEIELVQHTKVSRDAVLLWILSVTFEGAAKDWLKSLSPKAITTWVA